MLASAFTMKRKRRGPPRIPVLASSLLAVLYFSQPLAGQQETKTVSPLNLESIEVTPDKPGPDTLCKLRVRVRNAGAQTASRLAFGVRLNGERIAVYESSLFLKPIAPGGTVEVPLYNFWSTETSRPAPKEGKLLVEVELRQAEWMKVEKDAKGAEIWTPIGAVTGLPVSRSLTVLLQPRAR